MSDSFPMLSGSVGLLCGLFHCCENKQMIIYTEQNYERNVQQFQRCDWVTVHRKYINWNKCIGPWSTGFTWLGSHVGLITNDDETVYREEVRALGLWCLGKQPLTQLRQNKGDDPGLQETAEGAPPYLHRWDTVEKVASLKFLVVHITDILKWSNHTETWSRRRNSDSSTPGGWRNLSWHLKLSQTFTDAQLRASCQAVSPPVTATDTAWCGLPNTCSFCESLVSW